MPYLANFPGLCPFTHSISPVAMISWNLTHATGSALPCALFVPYSFTVVMYLMTPASFPGGVLIPTLYVSLVCETVCAILIAVALYWDHILYVCIQKWWLWDLVYSLLSWCLFIVNCPQEGSIWFKIKATFSVIMTVWVWMETYNLFSKYLLSTFSASFCPEYWE